MKDSGVHGGEYPRSDGLVITAPTQSVPGPSAGLLGGRDLRLLTLS